MESFAENETWPSTTFVFGYIDDFKSLKHNLKEWPNLKKKKQNYDYIQQNIAFEVSHQQLSRYFDIIEMFNSNPQFLFPNILNISMCAKFCWTVFPQTK